MQNVFARFFRFKSLETTSSASSPVILRKCNDHPVTPFSTGLAKNVQVARGHGQSERTVTPPCGLCLILTRLRFEQTGMHVKYAVGVTFMAGCEPTSTCLRAGRVLVYV